MESIRKVLTAALLVPFALASTSILASPQIGGAGEKDVSPQWTVPVEGDYAVIERTRIVDGIETESRIVLPWDMYEQKFGYDPNYEPPAQLNDEYESIVRTPGPPSGVGFNPGDRATLHRYATFQNDRYHRTTVYQRTNTGWGMQGNSVEVTGGGGGGCGSVDQPPCDAQ